MNDREFYTGREYRYCLFLCQVWSLLTKNLFKTTSILRHYLMGFSSYPLKMEKKIPNVKHQAN